MIWICIVTRRSLSMRFGHSRMNRVKDKCWYQSRWYWAWFSRIMYNWRFDSNRGVLILQSGWTLFLVYSRHLLWLNIKFTLIYFSKNLLIIISYQYQVLTLFILFFILYYNWSIYKIPCPDLIRWQTFWSILQL